MITWVTVWVLTVGYWQDGYQKGGPSTYQLQYATKEICDKQKKAHEKRAEFRGFVNCSFQQIPVVK